MNPDIDYSLNSLDQADPRLVQAIKDRFLLLNPPQKWKKLKLRNPATFKVLKGQFGQPIIVDELYK